MDAGLQTKQLIRPISMVINQLDIQDKTKSQDQAETKPQNQRQPAHQDKGDLKVVLIVIGLIGLGLILIPYAFDHEHQISVGTYKRMLFVGIVLWVLSALYWNKSGDQSDMLD